MKEHGLGSQTTSPATTTSDLTTRLGLARGAELVCPAPIDAAVSGLVPLAVHREASRALAKAAEAQVLSKTWLAVVRGDRVRDGVLEHRIHKNRGRLSAEALRGRAATAVTELRVRDRGVGASLVELDITRGRPAQLRAQLAAAGAPIAGDAERDGPAARRLMLHASVVDLATATTTETHRSDSPRELLEWLSAGFESPPGDVPTLRARIIDAASRRWGLAASVRDGAPTTAFRIVDGVGDGVPGLAIDLYGDHLVAHVYEELLPLPEADVLDVLADFGALGVYVKRRPVQANELVDTRRDDIAPAGAVRGVDAPKELAVLEEGVPYLVRLGDGLSTGLFLDQRDNRSRVRGWARGASVLNLFSYTCPFTVAAAVAGASRTVSIDAAGPSLDVGRANVENAAGAGDHVFLKADVFDSLDDLSRRDERFDLVIVDPPTYSTTRGARWTSGKSWVDLATRALGAVADGGRVLCSSNDRRMSEKKFIGYLRAALAADGREGRVDRHPPPADFPPPPGGEPHLKTGVIELR
jgi:23S rRNA (cytosine1962-C5)-methyltransferase